MKVARKLILAVVLGMILVLGGHAVYGVTRTARHAREDIRADHHIIARALRPALRHIWQTDTEARALEMLEYADSRMRRVELRWIWLDDAAAAVELDAADRERLARGDDVHVERADRLYTYVPLGTANTRPAALELSESLASEHAFVRAGIITEVLAAGVLAGLATIVTLVAGVVYVGRPMGRLVAQARQIGAGDLGTRSHLTQRDEIGELAHEMDVMCERLAGALQQARHADRLRTVGKLASGIAHELGTPLNVVAGRAKMIAGSSDVGDGDRDNARIVVEQTERMTKIIRQLLDFARQRKPEKTRADLGRLAADTVSLLSPLAHKSGVTVEVRDDGAGEVDLDAAQFQQALTNLIVNGVQALPRGGALTVWAFRCHATPPAGQEGIAGEYACVSVQDEGDGIAPDALPQIFEPFFTTKDIGQGTGLGLSVSYGIVREHGGWIAVDSEPGRGSRFTIYVPVPVPAEAVS